MTNACQVSEAIPSVAATLGIADLLEDGARSAKALPGPRDARVRPLPSPTHAGQVGVFAEEGEAAFSQTPLSGYLRTEVPGSVSAWAVQIGRP